MLAVILRGAFGALNDQYEYFLHGSQKLRVCKCLCVKQIVNGGTPSINVFKYSHKQQEGRPLYATDDNQALSSALLCGGERKGVKQLMPGTPEHQLSRPCSRHLSIAAHTSNASLPFYAWTISSFATWADFYRTGGSIMVFSRSTATRPHHVLSKW